jgi:mannose-6-phosphate isomerase-like protein (cupin superfamily)
MALNNSEIYINYASVNPSYPLYSDDISVRMTGNFSCNKYSILEIVSPTGGGSAPHLYEKHDVTIYLLEGEIEWTLPTGKFKSGPGLLIHVPKKTPYSFTSIGSVPAKFIMISSPPGLEDAFIEMSPLSQSPDTIDQLDEIASKHGIVLASEMA